MPRLIVFAGLPASGKSTIAREVALRTGAVWLRIDSLEQAILASQAVAGDIGDAGYRAACAAAEDNLRLGSDVIADCVNDWKIARDAWQDTGRRAGAQVLWVEIVCSDLAEHRRRVDVPGLVPPDWGSVIGRDYQGWDRDRLTVDTAGRTVADSVSEVLAAL